MTEPLPPLEHEFATLKTSRDPVLLALRVLDTIAFIIMAVCLIIIANTLT